MRMKTPKFLLLIPMIILVALNGMIRLNVPTVKVTGCVPE
jgi:hypothetical protein